MDKLDSKKITVLKNAKNKKISEYLEEYLADRTDLSQKTLNMDKTAINCFIDINGDIKISNVRKCHIAEMRRLHEYYIGKGKKRIISKTSVNAYLRHIKTFLNHAHENGMLHEVPKIKRLKTGETLPRILTQQERKALLDHTFKKDYEFHRIIQFALYTGCRRFEIKSARWEHYNASYDLLTVTGKGQKERNVPIIQEALFFMGPKKAVGFIFKQMHEDTYTHHFKKYARAVGIKGVHFHNLRHSAGTEMLEKGIRLEIIQKILGHSDIKTTQIYSKVLDQTMVKEMQKLSKKS